MFMFIGALLVAPPSVLSLPLFDVASGATYFSPSPIENAGNSTGILFSSALVSLLWLRRGGSLGAMALLALLGFAAGVGA